LLSSYVPFEKANLKLHEIINNGVFFENEDFILKAFRLEHTTTCLGYVLIEKDRRNVDVNYVKKFGLKQHPILRDLQQGRDIMWNGKKILAKNATKIKKGKTISIVLDSKACRNIITNVKNSDLLICEATLGDEFEEKADVYKHLTASQSAKIAKDSSVKKLILTHFSQRYKNVDNLVKDARKIFKNTLAAEDLMKVLV